MTAKRSHSGIGAVRLVAILGVFIIGFSVAFFAYSDNIFSDDGDIFSDDQFRYGVISETEREVFIMAYLGHDSSVILPSTVEHGSTTYAVTGINSGAFYNSTRVESVSMPDSIKVIGPEAFAYCTSLGSVTFSDGLKTISQKAFFGCSSLVSVTIPRTVETIDFGAFEKCSGLNRIDVDGLNEFYSSDAAGVLFDESMTILIKCPENMSGTYSMPQSVELLDNACFYNCVRLTHINISERVTTIGISALYNCTALRSIVIPDSVSTIMDQAFYSCTDLKSVVFGDGLRTIGISSFNFCDSLTSLNLPDNLKIIGEDAFRMCNRLTSVVIPDGVTIIDDHAFYYCASLVRAHLPASLESLGKGVFADCLEMIEYTVDEGNQNLVAIDGVLYSKDLLSLIHCPTGKSRSVIVPEGVSVLINSAFSGCSRLDSIALPKTLTTIQPYAFYFCSNLRHINIPDSVNTISDHAFEECSRLDSVSVPKAVASLQDSAFKSCTGLGSVSLPEGIGGIGNNVFQGCSNLTSVDIPDSVESIGQYAFDGCSSLTSIDLPAGLSVIESTLFRGCSMLESISIPSSVTSIGHFAFAGTGLRSITIPAGVTALHTNALDDCHDLERIDVADGNSEYASLDGVLFNKALSTLIEFPENKGGPYSIPSSVVTVDEGSFDGCSRLTSLFISAGVTSFPHDNLFRCSGLLSISVDDENPVYSSLDGVLFDKGMGALLRYPAAKGGDYVIPESVTEVQGYAFYMCFGLTSVKSDGNLLMIGAEAFDMCTSLVTVSLPDTVQDIGPSAFKNCSGLTSFTIPQNVSVVHYGTFENCVLLTSMEIHRNIVEIDISAFAGCDGITSITLHENVTNIGLNAFSRCTNLKEIVVVDGNEHYSSDEGVLFDRDMTTLIQYPTGKVGPYVIPDTVDTIVSDAFYMCYGLTSLTIPAGLKAIPGTTFNMCPNLKEFIVDPKNPNYRSIDGVIYNKALTDVIKCPGGKTGDLVLPASVDRIRENAFQHSVLDRILVTGGMSVMVFLDAFLDCNPYMVIGSGASGFDVRVFEGVDSYREMTAVDLRDGWEGTLYFVWSESPEDVPSDDSSAVPMLCAISFVVIVLLLGAVMNLRQRP